MSQSECEELTSKLSLGCTAVRGVMHCGDAFYASKAIIGFRTFLLDAVTS